MVYNLLQQTTFLVSNIVKDGRGKACYVMLYPVQLFCLLGSKEIYGIY